MWRSWKASRARVDPVSTYTVAHAGSRVVLIHDTPERTTISEMEISQAAILRERLDVEIAAAIAAVRGLSAEEIAGIG